MNLPTIDVKPGSEVLIKRAKQGRFQFYGYEYLPAVVSRVTKARIFTRALDPIPGAPEREFNRADMTERDGRSSYNKAELIADAAAIETARAEEAATKARRKLECEGVEALALFLSRYEQRRIENRTDDEIRAMIAAVKGLVGA